MNHGSLFSGIGGFDLAAEWMGWENKFHCEWNEFGQKVLHHYWPQAELFTDITKSDFTKYANKINVLSGGFPCQPYSSAGKRLGKEDDRHLWPSMLRAIREIQPRWVVGENVRGLTNWNGGLVFDEVQADLEAEGYEVTPFLLPACAVNAPHKRDRIWFVAHSKLCSNRLQSEGWLDMERSLLEGRERSEKTIRFNIITKDAADTNSRIYDKESIIEYPNSIGQERRMHQNKSKTTTWQQFSERNARSNGTSNWQNFPTQSPICDGDDGLSNRLDNITFPKWRNESIKAGGNAVVPQVVYQIFKAIEEYDK